MGKSCKFDLNSISKYRTELMGMSILVIMLFHCGLIPYGHIGVEFFLFISAIGLFYSLKKNSDTISFYNRRLKRILPTYFFLTIPYVLVYKYYHEDSTVGQLLEILFQIRTLTESMVWSQWFISLILICYLITPVFLKFNKVLLSYIVLFSFAFFTLIAQDICTPYYLLARVPIFLFSLKWASYIYEGKNVDLLRVILFLVFFILFSVLVGPWLQSAIPWFNFIGFVFLSMTFPLMILFTKCISYLPGKLLRILRFFGALSLELYLCHECVKYVIAKIYFQGDVNWSLTNILIISLLSFIFAIPIAYFSRRCVTWIVNKA